MNRWLISGLLLVVMLFAGNASGLANAAADEYDVREKLRNEGVWLTPEESAQQKAELDGLLDSLDNAANRLEKLKAPSLQVQINGSIVGVPPHMRVHMSVIEGQVMVPLSWMAGVLGATSVEWDAATRTATIKTPQDFYNMEKFSSYASALRSDIDEYNDQIWPLPDRVKNLQLPELVPDRQFIFELDQFNPTREGLALPAPRDYITITITSPDGIYEHSSVVHSMENHQDHYYLPMDWLEYLFNARVSYNEANNTLSIQSPDRDQIKAEIERIENALIPDSGDEAIKLWGRGLQTRNGALQYAALSPQLREEADTSAYVRDSYWVTGSSSPSVGPITITNQHKLSETKIEYTLSFPEIFSGQTYALATEKMVVEKLSDNGRDGWFITQIRQSSGYGIIGDETTSLTSIDTDLRIDGSNREFFQSVQYDPSQDLLSFTIPETVPEGKFYLHVSGRVYMGDKSNGMSWHAFDEETQNFSWESGKTYTHALNSENLDQCVLDFGLIDMNNQELLYSIDIFPDGTKKLANSEKLLSYIKAYDEKTGMLTFDEIEWVIQEDAKRVSELGLDADLDFPNGYFIHNENDQTHRLKAAENVKVYLVNWYDLANHISTDVNGLAERMAEYQAPYYLTIKDDVIMGILEQYTP